MIVQGRIISPTVETHWVSKANRISANVRIEIHPASDTNRILADPPRTLREVVPIAIVVQAGAVILPTSVLLAVVSRTGYLGARPIRSIAVMLPRPPVR